MMGAGMPGHLAAEAAVWDASSSWWELQVHWQSRLLLMRAAPSKPLPTRCRALAPAGIHDTVDSLQEDRRTCTSSAAKQLYSRHACARTPRAGRPAGRGGAPRAAALAAALHPKPAS